MLTCLQIKNFTIIDCLTIEFLDGMTVLTGETGAGKSIIIDTLNLILGERSDLKLIRAGTTNCEIAAIFNLNNLPLACTWLKEHDLETDGECIIRRVLSIDGRSRNSINGVPCPLQLLRELGLLLINIHGQHEQQNLFQRDHQLTILDEFAGHGELCEHVANLYKDWLSIKNQLTQIKSQNDHEARYDFLRHQLQELQQLKLNENELTTLSTEHKKLTHAEQLRQEIQNVLEIINQTKFYAAIKTLTNLETFSQDLKTIKQLIENAAIQVDEASSELEQYLNMLEINAEQLTQIETRLSQIHDLARKYHLNPENLLIFQEELIKELNREENLKQQVEELTTKLNVLATAYQSSSQQLSISRKQAAIRLRDQIVAKMAELNINEGKFTINFQTKEELSRTGLDLIEFQVSTNVGQPLMPLAKIVSGGELSRLSLAIQICTAQRFNIPTLIFDEIDTGVGGKIAEMVGKLLYKLSKKTQIICVTHLPQIASLGNHHFQISKEVLQKQTLAKVTQLKNDEKINEIARMLGGAKITKKALAHAREMCKNLCPKYE